MKFGCEFGWCLTAPHRIYVHVTVNFFLSQVNFAFLLFLVMVLCANEAETKEK